MAVAEARFDGARDPVHRRHCLDRILADRRLAREHHRRRAVQDRVRHVARLGARRLGLMDHRLEHLRRGDHRLSELERLVDDPLLDQGHDCGADLHPEVSAGDHHRVRLGEHRVEHVDGFGLLDLGDYMRVRSRLLDQSP